MEQNDNTWYKDAIIYEVHIKAFRDGNNDGIGDFKGLIEKLDHLSGLGVTAIWLLPFFPSPLKDDGYDIADYTSIHPDYGTIDDFQHLLQAAHSRNLRVIIELVINHTSDQHPWFKRAIASEKGSPERDYYVWSDHSDAYKDMRIIFQDFEKSNWTWHAEAGQFYWHRFFHHQPDLNYDNPKVSEEIFSIIDFWCGLGVDGFRLDAVPYLYEREGTNGENLPETHQFLKRLRKYIDEKYPATLLLAEANMWPVDAASYFGRGDECHMNFHFPLMPRMFMSIEMEDKYPVMDIFDQTPVIPDSCQWAIFLRNHDELTLEMVTDEERDYMYRTYAKDAKARINLGIRHRLAPLLGNNRRKIELMNSLLFSLPGTPVIYYGDEIGMGDNFYLGDRDGVRTPMQWSSDKNAGFSKAHPHLLYLPVILDPAYHFEALNVEIQKQNTSSLYWFMKRMIAARKKYAVFGRGDIQFINSDNQKILAFTRSYDSMTLLAVHNLSKFPQQAVLDLQKYAGLVPTELFSNNSFMPIPANSSYKISAGPHDFYWFLLNAESSALPLARSKGPAFWINEWSDLAEGLSKEILETNIFLSYFKKVKWFAAKSDMILGCTIRERIIPTGLKDLSAFFFVEVSYRNGSPDLVQLPVIFTQTAEVDKAILTEILVGDKKGFLTDALYISSFAKLLFDAIVFQSRNKIENHTLETELYPLHFEISGLDQPAPIETIDQSELPVTVVRFGKDMILRFFRIIDAGNHPSVELPVYLHYDHQISTILPVIGSLKWKTGKDFYVLGSLEKTDSNAISSYGIFRERVNNYIERLLARDGLEGFLRQMPNGLFEFPDISLVEPALIELFGTRTSSLLKMVGEELARCHLALAAGTSAAYVPEEFSLHYQQSLYSSIRGISRRLLARIERNNEIPGYRSLNFLVTMKESIGALVKEITLEKLPMFKIRIHGNLDLHHVHISGNQIYLRDFGGDPLKHLSRRRLKRSPLLDVASMIVSIFETTWNELSQNSLSGTKNPGLNDFAMLWSLYCSRIYLESYLGSIQGSMLIPESKSQLQKMLEVYIIELVFTKLSDNLDNDDKDISGLIELLKRILPVEENMKASDSR